MRANALHWVLRRLGGVLLLAGLGVHMYVMHFAAAGNVTYQAVSARLMQPGWIAFNAAFLLTAVYHGYGGLWDMAGEYLRPGPALKAARTIIVLLAMGIVLAGSMSLFP